MPQSSKAFLDMVKNVWPGKAKEKAANGDTFLPPVVPMEDVEPPTPWMDFGALEKSKSSIPLKSDATYKPWKGVQGVTGFFGYAGATGYAGYGVTGMGGYEPQFTPLQPLYQPAPLIEEPPPPPKKPVELEPELPRRILWKDTDVSPA